MSTQSPEQIKPYSSTGSKTEQVELMFDNIAPAYDFMNRAMTLGIDRMWRARAVGMIAARQPSAILDVATGTGDLAIAMARRMPDVHITGIDLSGQMLEVGRRKVEKAGLAGRVEFSRADCLHLPFADGAFSCVSVAYGVRNFENLLAGYREMARVLAPGGMLCVVELSVPQGRFTKPLYNLYTRTLIPAVGRMISSDSRAYSYLPESVAAMPQGPRMLALMEEAGLEQPSLQRLTFGACTIYTALRPAR